MSEIDDRHGSLFEDEASYSGEPPVVEISDDHMSAFLIVPSNPRAVDIRELIAESGASFGLKNDLIDEISHKLFKGDKLESRYEIMRGRKPVFGQPGELILRTNKPEDIILSSEDLTRVDYKTYRRKMLALAEKDKPVAMVIQPTKGHDGMDIFGNVLKGADGEEVNLILGENVFLSGKKLVSKIDGLIEYQKNSDGSINFDISEIYLVNGDVDYNTGNIDFPGSVIVTGVIKAGFEVRATKDVVAETIRGHVVTGGTVVAKQGIIGGTEKASIESNGAVYAKFVQYARIVAHEEVNIKKSIVSSEVYCESEVRVDGSPGTIMGGSIYAVSGVTAKVFGSESYVKTEVALYSSAKNVLLLRDIVAKRFAISKDLSRIETYLGANKSALFEGISGDKKEMLAKLLKKRDQLRKQLLEKNSELKTVQQLLTTPLDGRVTVEKAIWPEVRVSIAGKYILLKNEKKKGYFFYDKAEGVIDFK